MSNVVDSRPTCSLVVHVVNNNNKNNSKNAFIKRITNQTLNALYVNSIYKMLYVNSMKDSLAVGFSDKSEIGNISMSNHFVVVVVFPFFLNGTCMYYDYCLSPDIMLSSRHVLFNQT